MPIKVDIVTIEKMVYSDDVDMVVAPGTEGMLGILPRHAPLLTSLQFGELIVRKDGEEQAFAIGGGIMEVQPDKVTILARAAESADEINLERAQKARDRAAGMIDDGRLSPDEMVQVEAALKRAWARIKVAERRQNRRGGRSN